ncbi:MAG: bile acid:sodium symporter family protein, partial [Betaproteobacteria bacterium]
MQSGLISNLLLPLSLGIIMLGLGLSLTVADFSRVVRLPKAVFVGLTIQMVILT